MQINAQGGMSQDDQAMSRAIEASLSYNITEDIYSEGPLEERVREGDTWVSSFSTTTLTLKTATALSLFGPRFPG